MHIALLEDEPDLAAEVRALLEREGHSVITFRSGNHIIRALAHDPFDLLVLDWNVPGPNGLDVLIHTRQQLQLRVPVIFLTSNLAEEQIVQALNAGADDYCGKPLRAPEFTARLRAVERRLGPSIAPASPGGETEGGGYRFNVAERRVDMGEESVTLGEKEFELARLLFQNIDRPIARSRIMAHVWGREEDELSRTLDVHVSWLRRKLKLGAGGEWRLLVVRGYGYRLVKGEETV
ncbi:response regulator transcription factor [Roseateles sp.]|uniref:response regulator transcription factor n=1 Tax=Roseateles sp. TaxID=1971397 RepID=UPI003BA6EF88